MHFYFAANLAIRLNNLNLHNLTTIARNCKIRCAKTKKATLQNLLDPINNREKFSPAETQRFIIKQTGTSKVVSNVTKLHQHAENIIPGWSRYKNPENNQTNLYRMINRELELLGPNTFRARRGNISEYITNLDEVTPLNNSSNESHLANLEEAPPLNNSSSCNESHLAGL